MSKTTTRITVPPRAPKGTIAKVAQHVIGSTDSKAVRRVKYALSHPNGTDQLFIKKVINRYLKIINNHHKSVNQLPKLRRAKASRA